MSDFDPSRPFEVVSGSAPVPNATSFDPAQPFDVVGEAPAPSAGRAVGLGTRGVLAGVLDTVRNPAAAILNIPSVAVNTIAGRQVVPEPFSYNVGETIADTVGLPREATPAERITGQAVRGGAGMVLPFAGARAIQSVTPAAVGQARTPAQAAVGAFADSPAVDIAAGAVGGAAGGAVGEAGGGVVPQVAAELGGNVITAAILAAVARRRTANQPGARPEAVLPDPASVTPEEIAGVLPEVADAYRAQGFTDADIRQAADAFRLAEAQRNRAQPGVVDPQPGAAPTPDAASPRMAQDFQERAASPRNPEAPRAPEDPVVQEPPQTFRYTEPDPNVEFPGATTGARGERPQTAQGRTPFPDNAEVVPPGPRDGAGAPPPRGPDIDGDPAPRAASPEVQRIEAQIGRLTARGEPAPGTSAADQVARLRGTLQQIEGPQAPPAQRAIAGEQRPALPAPEARGPAIRLRGPEAETAPIPMRGPEPSAESAPTGQGVTQRVAGRDVATGDLPDPVVARGAAQEVGAPPRGTDTTSAPSLAERAAARAAEREARFIPQRLRDAEANAAAARQRAEDAASRYEREAASDFQYTGTGPNRAALTRARDTTAAALRDAEAAVDALRRRDAELRARNPQQGAPDAASAAPARPPEAPPSNVSEAPARAVPEGVTVYRNREEFSQVRHKGRLGERAIERLTRNGEPPAGSAAARQLGKARAAADAGRRASYDPEAPEAPRATTDPAADAGRAGGRPEDPTAGAPGRGEGDAGPAAPQGESAAARDGDGVEPGAPPLYANPLDPAAIKRFLVDPVANTARLLKDRLKTSVASIGTTPGPGAAFRLYADSNRATLLHYRERFTNVPGFPEIVDSLGATDPGSGRIVRGGFQQVADETSRMIGNRATAILQPLDNDTAALGRVRDILTGQNPRSVTPAERDVARRLRALLDEHHAWLSKRLGSVDREMGYVRGRYFPRRFDAEAIQADIEGFTRDATALYRRMGLDAEQARLAADEWGNRIMGVGGGAARYADTPNSAFTKGRTLPPEADTVMRKWLVTDPREAVIGYLQNSTRYAEFVSRFGTNGQKFDDTLTGVVKAGATPTEVAILRRAFAAATGTAQGAGSPTTGLLSWSQMWGMQQLLTRALFSSAAEPLSIGIRSGDLRDSARGLGNTWRRFLTPDSWQGSAMKMEAERAEMLGVLGDSTREMMMAARVEGQNVSAKHARAIDRMLTITGQNRLFAASRIASSRIAEHTIVKMVRDTKDPRAAGFLAEVGMDAPTAAAVRAWLNKHDGRPPIAEMVGDTPAANAYRTAVNRFVNESVINPLAIDKPIGASERHPLAQLAYGIMSFQYSFTRNVLIRTLKMGARGLTENMTAGERLAMLVPAVGLLGLSMAQIGMSEVRDAVFNRQARKERPAFVADVLALDRAGLFGNLSPLVNLVTSAKYERDASGALAGPYVGSMLRQVGDIGPGLIPQSLGGPNSPRTNNAEWAAARAAWGLVAAPAAVGVLASTPMPAWLKPAAGAAAMYVGSSDMSRTVATTVAGPRQQAGRTGGRRPENAAAIAR